ncbi:MAG: lantibiotic dehydratase [Pseudonocardiales bacterium]
MPSRWPALSDEHDCRSWLREVWPEIAAAVGHASPVLAARIATILADAAMSGRDVRRATLAVVRYVLRFGRSTPFGTFAGVSTVSVGTTAAVRFDERHRPVVRVDSRWLRQVVERLEACPGLLAQLDVVFTDAAEKTGGRLTLLGAELISIRYTPAVALARETAASPVRFRVLADVLADAFPNAGDPSRILLSLLDNGFLLTSLRVPSTITDPLAFVVDHLRGLDIDDLPVAPLARELGEIHQAIEVHNHNPSENVRTALAARLRQVIDSVRVPLSVDLRLDAHVRIPHSVAREMERAAGVLARLMREHTGSREWRDYFAAFCDRYGIGTLVPLRMVVDPDLGLGWPRGYPGSPEASGRHVFSERDRLLFALATEATARGDREIELDGATVDNLVAAGGEPDAIPPHIDLGARIHATSRAALDRGEYMFTVVPGRAVGTLTSRFTRLAPDADLGEVFAEVPTTTAGALPAQSSFTPMFPSAENVARVPRYLPHVVSIGEHARGEAIGVDDLAVTATTRRLHLVSLSRRRVVEPMVLHALALKQQPSMARLVGELSRALDGSWIGFDWGAAETLPFRPRVRYGRAILSAARWRLTRANLPAEATGRDRALDRWRQTWRCPSRVELRDFDQLLPLDLDVPAHREILYRHLRGTDKAILIEAPEPGADGWLDGHAHTVVLPLTSCREPAPGPRVDVLPVLGREHGHTPGSPGAAWLYAKLHVAEHRMNTLLVDELPALLGDLGDRAYWFVRYPQAHEGEESDHLRLRVRVHGDADKVLSAVTEWADRLRADGRLSRLAFDTYYPETGRYLAIEEAEAVFAADSRFVLALLTHRHGGEPSPIAITALSMFDVAAALLGDRDQAATWLGRQAPKAAPDRADIEQITRLVRGQWWHGIPGWPQVARAHQDRADALDRYRRALPEGVDTDAVLHSVLHMHHNRALGVGRDREAVCLRLARKAAATWRACRMERG